MSAQEGFFNEPLGEEFQRPTKVHFSKAYSPLLSRIVFNRLYEKANGKKPSYDNKIPKKHWLKEKNEQKPIEYDRKWIEYRGINILVVFDGEFVGYKSIGAINEFGEPRICYMCSIGKLQSLKDSIDLSFESMLKF